MSDLGDPKFKLFGKTIPLNSYGEEVAADLIDRVAELDADKRLEDSKSTDETALQANSCPRVSEDQNPPIIIVDESSDADTQKDEKAEGQESNNSQEKTMKKPDKILPCPRCNSKDTKFCYYNNYNVHQPRHFCKSCQRYWTAGGTMRNVPVGAGRRKIKSASSKYCHISISDALQVAARMDLPNGSCHTHQHQAGLKMNGTVLTFGADSQVEPMASMMNLAENKLPNGFQVHSKTGENGGDDRSSGSSSVTTSGGSVVEEGGLKKENSSLNNQTTQNTNVFSGHHHQVSFFPGYQMAYGFHPSIPMPPPPSGFAPIPFYPVPIWNGAPIPWNAPWVNSNTPGTNSSLLILGKHPRDEDALNAPTEAEKRSSQSQVLLPKTLRIDNPEEAAKSSIWTTLGIKKVDTSGNGGGFFKGLQSKGEEKKHKMENNSPLLNANPAAVARSISFQETA